MFHILNNVHKSSSRTTSYASVSCALNGEDIYEPRLAGRSLKADRFFFWVTVILAVAPHEKGFLSLLLGCLFPKITTHQIFHIIFHSPHWIKGLAWMENTRKGPMDRPALSSFHVFLTSFLVFLDVFLLTADTFFNLYWLLQLLANSQCCHDYLLPWLSRTKNVISMALAVEAMIYTLLNLTAFLKKCFNFFFKSQFTMDYRRREWRHISWYWEKIEKPTWNSLIMGIMLQILNFINEH